MALDGKTLAAARDALAAQKRENKALTERRRAQVREKYPDIRALDDRLRTLAPRAIGEALRSGADPRAAAARAGAESLALQAEIAEKLTERGYPADYMEEVLSCGKCRDSGYVMGRMCSCLREKYDREAARSLSRLFKLGNASFDGFDLSLYSDAPPPNGGSSPREHMELVYENCLNYALHFGRDSSSLLLRGGTGLGKTFLSACIARVVAEKGFSVVYETVSAALREIRLTKKETD